jgi:broad specificity phosphatase PhoE
LIKIYIARHGETTWNVEGRIQGRSDPELSPKGYEQSLALLKELKDRPLSAIYASTLTRSILTAEPVAGHLGIRIRRQAELDEIAFGILEGVRIAEINGDLEGEWERFKRDRLAYHIPGAENYSDVADRLRPFMERILREHEGEEILIVGHRGANRMLMGMLLGYPLEKCLKIEQANDCIYLIQRHLEIKIAHTMNGVAGEGLILEGHEIIL